MSLATVFFLIACFATGFWLREKIFAKKAKTVVVSDLSPDAILEALARVFPEHAAPDSWREWPSDMKTVAKISQTTAAFESILNDERDYALSCENEYMRSYAKSFEGKKFQGKKFFSRLGMMRFCLRHRIDKV